MEFDNELGMILLRHFQGKKPSVSDAVEAHLEIKDLLEREIEKEFLELTGCDYKALKRGLGK